MTSLVRKQTSAIRKTILQSSRRDHVQKADNRYSKTGATSHRAEDLIAETITSQESRSRCRSDSLSSALLRICVNYSTVDLPRCSLRSFGPASRKMLSLTLAVDVKIFFSGCC